MSAVQTILLLIGAWLIGSVPFAIVSSRLFGLEDPRHYGSGNPGATNVLRSGSKGAAALTLLGDCSKGWFAVWLATKAGGSPVETTLAGLAAFFGHVFSVFLHFRGGKGVATALGVLVGIDIRIAGICLAVWLGCVFATRYSSAAAIAAAAVAPVAGFWLSGNRPVAVILAAMSAVLLWRHADNIKRLMAGTEDRIRRSKNGAE